MVAWKYSSAAASAEEVAPCGGGVGEVHVDIWLELRQQARLQSGESTRRALEAALGLLKHILIYHAVLLRNDEVVAVILLEGEHPGLADVGHARLALDIPAVKQWLQLITAIDSSRQRVYRCMRKECQVVEELHHDVLIHYVVVHLASRQQDISTKDGSEARDIGRWIHAPGGPHVAVAIVQVGKLSVFVGFKICPEAVEDATVFDSVLVHVKPLRNICRDEHTRIEEETVTKSAAQTG